MYSAGITTSAKQAGRGAGFDPGSDRAVSEADLQGQGARSAMMPRPLTPRPLMPGTFMRALALIATLIVATNPAQAAEIHALITTAMKDAIDELVPKFERDTGNTVGVSYGPSGGISRRFIGGEPADAIVIDSGALDDLIRQGKKSAGRDRYRQHRDRYLRAQGRAEAGMSRRPGSAQTRLAGGKIHRAHRACGRRHHRHPHHEVVRAPRHRGRGHAQGEAVAAGGPNGRVSVLVSSGEAEIGLQQVSELDVEPRRGRDRHAARGAATDRRPTRPASRRAQRNRSWRKR